MIVNTYIYIHEYTILQTFLVHCNGMSEIRGGISVNMSRTSTIQTYIISQYFSYLGRHVYAFVASCSYIA